MKSLIVRFVRDEEGQDIIEYALLAAFVSVVAWTILDPLGKNIVDVYENVDTQVKAAETAAS